MTQNLTPKRAAAIIDVAKEKGVKSGAVEMNGARFEFSFLNEKPKNINEWDSVIDEN